MKMSEAVIEAARAGHVKIEPPQGLDTWQTKDGRKIPVRDLGDDHLLNILRMLRRQAVAHNAARTVEMVISAPGSDMSDGAMAAFDSEMDAQERTDWRDALPPEWPALMAEARRRPATSAESIRIAGDSLKEAQTAIEIALLKKTTETEES